MATEQRTIPAVCPGTDLKFRLTTTKDDFTLAGDKWNIVIKNNLGRTVRRITKNDCYYDDQGRWYFNITNPQVGTYTAIFIGAYEDEDYDEQQRIWTDRQVLFVCREGCVMRQRRQRHPAACPVRAGVELQHRWRGLSGRLLWPLCLHQRWPPHTIHESIIKRSRRYGQS